MQTPKKNVIIVFLFCTLYLLNLSFLKAQIIFDKPLSNRVANYDISVNLDPLSKLLQGSMILNWKNISNDTIYELQFHLYLNAFKNTKSTFFKERGGYNKLNSSDWGWIDILRMSVVNGELLSDKIKYIQPDDNNEEDQTVIKVTLSEAILPQNEIELEISFLAKLPKIIARSGFERDDYFFIAQWFPKIGVYEPANAANDSVGRWNCHQYHSNTEFFADFGVYNVDITVPKGFIVGATGEFQKEQMNGDNTKTVFYRAEDVIDFAWTASPLYHVKHAQWKDVNIKVLYYKQRKGFVDRHIESLKKALDYFEHSLEKYPYKNITIVDPPYYGINSGGMEYPTLFTTGSVAWLPNDIRMPEMVTIHEFGHNYFMGIIATNEFEEPWLDEGMNSYFESKIMDFYYGEESSLIDILGFPIGDTEYHRISYSQNSNREISKIAELPWNLPRNTYGLLNYNKMVVVLHTLENIIGEEAMFEIMKKYYQKWKFKHPKTSDFIEIVNDVVKKRHGKIFGLNMNWYFDETLNSEHVCDYRIQKIINKYTDNKSYGVFDNEESKVTIEQKSDKSKFMYLSQVYVQRIGNMKMPVELLVRFENGEEKLLNWDGFEREKIFYFENSSKIVMAQIDPENKILLDVDLHNNSYTLKPDRKPIWKYTVRFLFWLQNIFQTIAFLA